MTRLYRVLYCSRNSISNDHAAVAAEISGILARSRHNNARDGITGGLLFSQGSFAQVLEGPLAAIEATFERIQCDERHMEVTVLQSGVITARDFPNWSMAFTGTNAANPMASGALADAFAGRSVAGDAVLATMRSVVVREHEWLVSDAA